MFKSILCTISILLVSSLAIAQKIKAPIGDSLANKDYKYYRLRYQATKNQPVSTIYAKNWLEKAKEERNFEQIALAYQALMYKAEKHNRINYTDSILSAAIRTKDNAQIGAAYLTRGTTYYDLKKHNLALDNYIIANEYIANTKDQYLIYKVKYTIAQTKLYLGFYDEAVALFTECLAYFEEENDRAFLNTVHSLGLCYNKMKKYDLCTQYNKYGKEVSKEVEIAEMNPYFDHSEGINQYFLNNYTKSIELITQSLPTLMERKDEANKITALFYLGKNYAALKKTNKAIAYFLQVDSQISTEGYLRPDIRENFELLIDHFHKENDLNKELHYVKRLLEVDKLLSTNFRYLSTKIHKEYDTKKLLSSKENIEIKLNRNKISYTVIIIFLSAVLGYLSYRHFITIKRYKAKFNHLMTSTKVGTKLQRQLECSEELDIAPELIDFILKNLEQFEEDKKFMEKDMNIARMAELLQTNTKYVSKIIPKYRGKKIIPYISDLKIDYLVELMKTDKLYRKFTNKGLADTAGFGSTQNFTIAFKARTGISPTFFIQELNKGNDQQ